MSDKKNADYKRLLDNLGCKAENLLMIGNSIKSDIIPILELGGYAAYVPHHITWAHEQCEGEVTHSHFIKLNNIKEIQTIFSFAIFHSPRGNSLNKNTTSGKNQKR